MITIKNTDTVLTDIPSDVKELLKSDELRNADFKTSLIDLEIKNAMCNQGNLEIPSQFYDLKKGIFSVTIEMKIRTKNHANMIEKIAKLSANILKK